MYKTESFRVSKYNEELISENHVITKRIFRKNVSFDKFNDLKEKLNWDNLEWDNDIIYCFIATKKIPIKNGGKWMCKVCDNSNATVTWSYEADNLSDRLEASVLKCVNKINNNK